jgi:hypothetical protein
MNSIAALRKETDFDPQEPPQSRDEVLVRYRRLRQIGKRHHEDVLAFLSKDAMFDHARRLGLTRGKILVADSIDQMTMAMDLAIYTAAPGRSRAIDRYANSGRWAPGSEEAIMLEVMRNARFGVLQVKGRHPTAGLIVTEVFRQIELWLVDENMEATMPVGVAFAGRFFTPGPFVMNAGVGVPLTQEALRRVLFSLPKVMRKPRPELVQDRRFAEMAYRNAIEDGSSETMAFRDPGGGDED